MRAVCQIAAATGIDPAAITKLDPYVFSTLLDVVAGSEGR